MGKKMVGSIIPRVMFIFICLAASTISILTLIAKPADAEYLFTVYATVQTNNPDVAQIVINDKVVLQLRSESKTQTALDRANVIAARIKEAISNGVTPDKLKTASLDTGTGIYADDKLLVLISKSEAKTAGFPPETMAKAWLDTLKAALTPPTLTLADKALIIPLNGNKYTVVAGTTKGYITASNYDPEIVDVLVDQEYGMVQVWGKAVGRTTITVDREGITQIIQIDVRKLAGKLTDAVTVNITGEPAPASLILKEIMKHYSSGLELEPGAQVTVTGKIIKDNYFLNRGESTIFYVPVKLFGEQYINVLGKVPVKVVNEAIPYKDAGSLWVSNSPERLKRAGLLFHGTLNNDEVVRFLFHHFNDKTEPKRDLVFEILNTGTTTARVHLIQGMGGPSTDEIYVGHVANKAFLENYYKTIGWFEEIKPGETRTIVKQGLSPGQILSGLWQLRLLQGEQVQVYLSSREGDNVNMVEIPSTDDTVLTRSKGIVTNPRLSITSDYTIGQVWSFVDIGGNKQQVYTTEGKPVYGNFGVIHDVTINVTNPLEIRKKVEVVLTGGGGAARGIVLINGQLIDIPILKQYQEYPLAQFYLEPNATQSVSLEILPESGSNYPVNIVTRSKL